MHTDKKYNKVIEEWRVQAMLSYLYLHLGVDSNEHLQEVISNYQNFVANTAYDPKKEIVSSNIKMLFTTDGEMVIDTSDEKKLKGYQFDSLVYRYIRAREAMAEWEWERNGKDKERRIYFERADRDILRFCQILNEAIGEHD